MGLLFGPRLRPGLLKLDSAELQGMGLPNLAHRQQAATTTESMTPPSSTACVVLLLLLAMTSCLRNSVALSKNSICGSASLPDQRFLICWFIASAHVLFLHLTRFRGSVPRLARCELVDFVSPQHVLHGSDAFYKCTVLRRGWILLYKLALVKVST